MNSSALHVAIIMDGNGRWAAARGRPRSAGHRAGAKAVRRVVEGAPALGIGVLTLYAFSSDNWQRPVGEVAGLMRLFERFLRGETARCVAEGVRLRVVGRRDRLAPALVRAIEAAESATVAGSTLELNLAVDYSSRHAMRTGDRLPDVDLLIRTGGEQRLSDFLLWECAYAELLFTRCNGPTTTHGVWRMRSLNSARAIGASAGCVRTRRPAVRQLRNRHAHAHCGCTHERPSAPCHCSARRQSSARHRR